MSESVDVHSAKPAARSSAVRELFLAGAAMLALGAGAFAVQRLLPGRNAGGALASAPSSAPLRGEAMDGSPSAAAPAPAVPAPTAAAAPAKSEEQAEFTPVTFEDLASYLYEVPEIDGAAAPEEEKKKLKDQFPAAIKALRGKKIAVQGFMVPLEFKKGTTRSFLLVRNQSLCCFGRMPAMNEWVKVEMVNEKRAAFINDQPVTVYGVFDVGEEILHGNVASIYRMTSEQVAGPLDL